MTKKTQRHDIDTAAKRRKLPWQHRPYFCKIKTGHYVGYVVSAKGGAGAWRGRGPDLKEFHVGNADDTTVANGDDILNIDQAIEKVLARINSGAPKVKGNTLRYGLEDAYPKLLARNGKAPINATTVYNHVKRIVPELLDRDLDGISNVEWLSYTHTLINGTEKEKGIGAPAWNRHCKNLAACLNIVARATKDAWLPYVKMASRGTDELHNNVVITSEQRRAWVAASYSENARFGLYVDVIAETGTRPCQASRLRVKHLQAKDRRLTIPRAGKGKGDPAQRKAKTYVAYISPELTARLVAAAKGRGAEEPLLLRDQGDSWEAAGQARAWQKYGDLVTRTLRAIDLETNDKGKKVGLYALRHTLITERIKGKLDASGKVYLTLPIPTLTVAKWHDTSAGQIEEHYAAEINEDAEAEALARQTIPSHGITLRQVA